MHIFERVTYLVYKTNPYKSYSVDINFPFFCRIICLKNRTNKQCLRHAANRAETKRRLRCFIAG